MLNFLFGSSLVLFNWNSILSCGTDAHLPASPWQIFSARDHVVFAQCAGCSVVCPQGYCLRLVPRSGSYLIVLGHIPERSKKLHLGLPWQHGRQGIQGYPTTPRQGEWRSQTNWLHRCGQVVLNSQQKIMCQTSSQEDLRLPGKDVTTTSHINHTVCGHNKYLQSTSS